MPMSRNEGEALRRRAEAYLKKTCHSISYDRSKQDAMTLVHELQVYQIELEMQCEELRRAQQDLEDSRDRYAELYESIPVGYFTFDRQGTMVDVNPAGCAMLNRPRHELIGRRFQIFVPTDDRRVFTAFCKRVLDSQESQTCEIRLSASTLDQPETDEPAKSILIEGQPAKKGDSPTEHLRAVIVDITARKEAERRLERQDMELRASRQKLQEMNSKVLNARDEERRVIARELHDDCCQQLALSIITTNSIQQITGKPASDKLRTLSIQLKQVLDTVRHVAYGLHPAMWETTSIEEAVRNYIEDFRTVTQLPVDVTISDVPAHLPQTVMTCLFRTLQETLHNIVKYASASQITIHLEKLGDLIQMTVTDNGKGFNIRNAASPRGLGLISMQERVRLLEGRLDIQSEPGKGATVKISLPLTI